MKHLTKFLLCIMFLMHYTNITNASTQAPAPVAPAAPTPLTPPSPSITPTVGHSENCLGITDAQKCSSYPNCFWHAGNSCRPVLYCPTLNQTSCSAHSFVCSWNAATNACGYSTSNNICYNLNKVDCNKFATNNSNDGKGNCYWSGTPGSCLTGQGPQAS